MQRSLRIKLFGSWTFYKMALAIAVPIMIQNGITQFVSMLDNIMVGNVGTEQMTGVSIANTLIFVYSLTIFGAVSGAGIYGAQFFGSKNTDGVRYAFRYKIIVCTLLTAVGIAILLIFDDQLIGLYLKGEGTAAEKAATLGYAKEYLSIMVFGLVPFALSQSYSGTLRESDQTVVPMVAGIVAVLVNLGLNTVLIFGYLGAPALGSAGAALATVISRYVEMGIVAVWTHRHKTEQPFIQGAFRSLHIPRKLVWQITQKSFPLLINETLWAGGMALLSQCYSVRGFNVVAAEQICRNVSNVFNVAFLAMGSAIGIIVGQLLGADKRDEAVDTDRKLIVFSVLMCIAIGGAMALLSPLFPPIFSKVGEESQALAAKFICITALCMPINSLANACYFTLRSGGKTFVTILFDSMFVCCVTVPTALVLANLTKLHIVPLFMICQLVDILKCVIGIIMIKRGTWIHNIVKE